jgi:hypothetical protein
VKLLLRESVVDGEEVQVSALVAHCFSYPAFPEDIEVRVDGLLHGMWLPLRNATVLEDGLVRLIVSFMQHLVRSTDTVRVRKAYAANTPRKPEAP